MRLKQGLMTAAAVLAMTASASAQDSSSMSNADALAQIRALQARVEALEQQLQGREDEARQAQDHCRCRSSAPGRARGVGHGHQCRNGGEDSVGAGRAAGVRRALAERSHAPVHARTECQRHELVVRQCASDGEKRRRPVHDVLPRAPAGRRREFHAGLVHRADEERADGGSRSFIGCSCAPRLFRRRGQGVQRLLLRVPPERRRLDRQRRHRRHGQRRRSARQHRARGLSRHPPFRTQCRCHRAGLHVRGRGLRLPRFPSSSGRKSTTSPPTRSAPATPAAASRCATRKKACSWRATISCWTPHSRARRRGRVPATVLAATSRRNCSAAGRTGSGAKAFPMPRSAPASAMS